MKKKGKSDGVNIPAELAQTGREEVITAVTTICNDIWRQENGQLRGPSPWSSHFKKGKLQQCHNYGTISLISHPSKVMLKIILKRPKPQPEKNFAEEQPGFRAGRSITEQIFNLRILCGKHLEHQPALWATMKKCNISTNLIGVIKNLYDKATSAVFFNRSIGDWFRTTLGVRHGCLLSLKIFNIFLERITTDALEDHEGTVSIGGRTITNLRFTYDINSLAGRGKRTGKFS